MMTDLYQRFTVSTGDLIGVPAPLPDALVGLDGATLLDLDVIVPPPAPFEGQGFRLVEMPVFPVTPSQFYLSKVLFERRLSDAEYAALDALRLKVGARTASWYTAPTAEEQALLPLVRPFGVYDATVDVNVLDPELRAMFLALVPQVFAAIDRVDAILTPA